MVRSLAEIGFKNPDDRFQNTENKSMKQRFIPLKPVDMKGLTDNSHQ